MVGGPHSFSVCLQEAVRVGSTVVRGIPAPEVHLEGSRILPRMRSRVPVPAERWLHVTSPTMPQIKTLPPRSFAINRRILRECLRMAGFRHWEARPVGYVWWCSRVKEQVYKVTVWRVWWFFSPSWKLWLTVIPAPSLADCFQVFYRRAVLEQLVGILDPPARPGRALGLCRSQLRIGLCWDLTRGCWAPDFARTWSSSIVPPTAARVSVSWWSCAADVSPALRHRRPWSRARACLRVLCPVLLTKHKCVV